jgi:hypothetical protein
MDEAKGVVMKKTKFFVYFFIFLVVLGFTLYHLWNLVTLYTPASAGGKPEDSGDTLYYTVYGLALCLLIPFFYFRSRKKEK